jgi:hypothetical protein
LEAPVEIFLYAGDLGKTFNHAVTKGAKVLDPFKDQVW